MGFIVGAARCALAGLDAGGARDGGGGKTEGIAVGADPGLSGRKSPAEDELIFMGEEPVDEPAVEGRIAEADAELGRGAE